jgi:small subunit ribosomal protein S6
MVHSVSLPASSRAARSRAALAGEADSDHGKEAFGNVIAYEVLVMLDPELADERQSEVIDRMRELVERGGGRWTSHDAWGRRRLAYEIDHKAEGTYHLVTFDAEPETLAELSRILRITEGVMRHLAVRRVAGGRTSAPPPPREPASVGAPDYSANRRSQEEE